MRVIAGTYRGKKLAGFDGKEIRPTADRVKESLFGILSPRLAGARVLDLFCGSGSLGIECLSRGAAEVRFNDVSADSLALLKKNLSFLTGKPYTVTKADYRDCLLRETGQFDLVFLDPPYRMRAEAADALALLAARGLLRPNGVAIYETESGAADAAGLECFDTRSYGRTKLHFYRIPMRGGTI